MDPLKSESTEKDAENPEERKAEAEKILWKAIEEARMYMEDPILTSEERRRIR